MFIAEDGTGLIDANSLISVEFADSYHADRGNTQWAGLSLERKQQLLIRATDYIVNIYTGHLLGDVLFVTQALPFPRLINFTSVGIPTAVRKAVAELALVANTIDLIPNQVKRGKKRVKIGPLEVEYDGNSPVAPKFVTASLMLQPWLKASINPNVGRVIRV